VSPARAFAQAAESFSGTRFRLHGRDPATGLDCVGLVAAALAAIGREAPVPAGYRLRNTSIDAALACAAGAGFVRRAGEPEPGDVLLVRPGPFQHHLLVALAGGRFVHAHAGLRRVTVTPGPLAWPILRHWRLAPSVQGY
jgi:cell wall-associated NlpC family hydrolase